MLVISELFLQQSQRVVKLSC